jgi:ABC-2 type transport system permease protein
MSTVGILAARDYLTRLRSRGFIIGTILGSLGIIGLSFVPVIFGLLGNAFTSSIVLVGPDPATDKSLQRALAQDFKVTVARQGSTGPALPSAVRNEVQIGLYDAALVAYRTKEHLLAFAYYPAKSASLENQENLRRLLLGPVVASDFSGANARYARRAIDFPFTTTNLNTRYKSAAEAGLAQGLVYFLLLLLYISVIMYGVYVAQGVIEEKSNRIMEIMIAVVRPNQLLAGKILGIGALALSQMLFFALVALVMIVLGGFLGAVKGGAHSAAGAAIATVPGSTLAYLLVFFLLGFFSYATMFAGVGALASKAEDVQQSNGPLILPIVAAYMLSIFALQDPDKPFLVWASLVPLISPMLMFTRVATSSVPAWQITASIGLSLLAIWLFTMLAAKLYRVGVLMYGKPLSPKEIWRALRAPS